MTSEKQGATLKITPIVDIVPHILAHVKTLPLAFTLGEGEYEGVGCWEFQCGEETWFPQYVEDAVDFEAAMQAKAITYVEPCMFHASYWSDEIHRYKVLWFNGEFVAINFKVGDTSHSRTLWFKEGDRARIIGELLSRFPLTREDGADVCEIYTPETGAEISTSQYLDFVTHGSDIYAINKLPNHGSMVGKRFMCLVKRTEDPEKFTLLGEAQRHIEYNAIGYTEHKFEDGSMLKLDRDNEDTVLRIERVGALAEESRSVTIDGAEVLVTGDMLLACINDIKSKKSRPYLEETHTAAIASMLIEREAFLGGAVPGMYNWELSDKGKDLETKLTIQRLGV